MSTFRRVSAGTPKRDSPTNSAAWISGVSEAADYYHSKVAGGQSGGAGGNLRELSGQIRVRNLTGANRRKGDVVQCGASLLTAVDPRHPWFEGNTPAAPASSKFAILLNDVKDNEINRALTVGVCQAWVDVTSLVHGYATPTAGQHVLASSGAGPAEIISPLTETGEQKVIVRLGGSAAGSLILCQVNKASHVFPSETTFPVNNVIIFSGSGPSAGSEVTDSEPPSSEEDEPVTDGGELVTDGGTIANFWQELLFDDEWLWAAYDAANDRWIPDRVGTKLRDYIATSTIAAATGFGAANFGTGTVQIKHHETGSDVGSPVAVKNSYRDAFPAGTVGLVDAIGGHVRIVTAGCTLAS